MHKTFSITFHLCLFASTSPCRMQMRPFFDRSLPAIMLQATCSLIMLDARIVRIVYLDQRSVSNSRGERSFFPPPYNNNNCIRNRSGKEQWRIRRFNLEFTTNVKAVQFARVCIPTREDSRDPIQRGTITRPVLPNCTLFSIQTTQSTFYHCFRANFL